MKIVAIFSGKAGLRLAIVLIAVILSGCADEAPRPNDASPGKEPPIRLEYWTPFSGGDNQFMTEMVERFNKEHGSIQVVQVNSRLDEYYSRLRTAILSGNAPDVAIIHTTILPQFVQNNYIENLTVPAQEVGLRWDEFNANILESTVYDGIPYAVPLDTHALVMYYNKTWLQAAGVLGADEKPVIQAGPEGFVAFLQAIKAAVPPDVAPMAQPSTRIDSVWLWWSLYNQMEGGGAFYDENSTKAVFDNPQSLQALELIHDLYRSELIPPDINDAFKMFYDGKAAVLITGMWGTGAFEHNKALHFGVVPMPVLYDRPAVWGDSHTLAIPTKHGMSDAKRKAVATFAQWIVEHGEMWAEAGHVPSATKVLGSDAFQGLKYRSDYAATANYVAYWPRHVKQWTVVEWLIKEFEKMNYGRQTPEETLRAAAKRVNSELAK
ncbi:hypothetical protein PAE9249_03019 [Paenibacillus sp. CECT 9249]|uniref:ABC transporter substrate-binding protein n=1 Tax=Paenibacillus sp. CECT 9249 TaxID=2845385 RepID=UPI001E2C5D67|nr:ABC transporter substrate-binding protein [Paenibacillus sp. CECT 9249]CAH0120500.1 hypothetical protein PAE9249_03019 [Paenibacillus sp. CECT 9249]